jgi:hypothetical protein
LQSDPIGYGDDMNMYAYVGADPVNATDPSGKYDVSATIAMNNECKGDASCEKGWVYRQPGEAAAGLVAGVVVGSAVYVAPSLLLQYAPQMNTAAAVISEAIAPGTVVALPAGGVAVSTLSALEKTGFHSFAAFKNAFGAAGPSLHWHHIVEQTPHNISKFGSHAIHNTTNVVKIDSAIHVKISAYYSSIQPFTNGLTVRKWLSSKSFDEQESFGQEAMRRFGDKR